ncbi:MAG: SGNH/GDSL hydrolase family protein [Brevefilum sp.]
MSLIFRARETIEFIGDSITDCGRKNSQTLRLGEGYVRLIHDLLQAGYPELQLKIVNQGISGDRVTDLKSRWKPDVIDSNPDWLFIYIGVNDVWRFFEGNQKEAVSLRHFKDIYSQLIIDTQINSKAKLRLVAPFLAENNTEDPFLKKLAQYQKAVDNLAEDFKLKAIHLQPAFDWAMLSQPAPFWTTDRVHPTREGHMLIALTILRACGYSI